MHYLAKNRLVRTSKEANTPVMIFLSGFEYSFEVKTDSRHVSMKYDIIKVSRSSENDVGSFQIVRTFHESFASIPHNFTR